MTLADRVRAATAETDEHRARAGDAEELRRRVTQRMPFELIASIASDSPERARNELRAACRRELSSARWDGRTQSEKARLVEDLMDLVFGFGPIESLVYDESVTEIMINGTQSIYYEKEGRLHLFDARFESDDQIRVLIDRIVGPLGRRIDESSPMVNARLPQGHRVNAIIPPLSPDGPVVTIRAFSHHVMSLEEMIALGTFDENMARFFGWVVPSRMSVVVSGGTGSGKTTLLNALSRLIPHEERVITIEDSAELRFLDHPHVVRLEARPRNAEGEGEVTIRDLVVNALRMRPDRIVVGECRSGEALDMLQAMNTGHEGSLTTLHANAAAEVVDRMVTMVRYVVDLPIDAVEAQIGNAFDFIVQMTRAPDGSRFVSQLAEVSFDREKRACVVEPIYARGLLDACGRWLRAPARVGDFVERGVADEKEVDRWKASILGL